MVVMEGEADYLLSSALLSRRSIHVTIAARNFR
jgi:hypothetical protein